VPPQFLDPRQFVEFGGELRYQGSVIGWFLRVGDLAVILFFSVRRRRGFILLPVGYCSY